MSNPVISVKNLSISYDNHSVLNDLNFEVKDREFIAIVGKSGAGKTTLLNALAGFIKYKGSIVIPASIGFCFQNHSLFYWMTVVENIEFGLDRRIGSQEKTRIVSNILEKIGLLDFGNKYPNELSGGQMQRVALGRALANNPEVLLLDEPFSSLDIYTRDQMIDWVLKIVTDWNITIIMVTHYLDEALALADRIFVLKEKVLSAEIEAPFRKPRSQALRFTEQFQKSKQELTDLLNHK